MVIAFQPHAYKRFFVEIVAALILSFTSLTMAQSNGLVWESQEFRDWTLACPATSQETSTRGCLLTQSLTLDDGRRLMAIQLSASLADRTVEPSYTVVLSTPLNVYLPAGARLRIDASASLRIGYERCDGAGCYAGTPLSNNLDNEFEEGTELFVSIQDLNGREVTGKLSLLGYTAGMQALRATDG